MSNRPPEPMARYLRRVQEIETAEITATWRQSPFYTPLTFTALTTPCGCTIEGDGNLKSPLRIKFCEDHAKAPVACKVAP